jgi:hypothetical protein
VGKAMKFAEVGKHKKLPGVPFVEIYERKIITDPRYVDESTVTNFVNGISPSHVPLYNKSRAVAPDHCALPHVRCAGTP